MKLPIQKSPCDHCLFSKNRIVSNERMREILAECAANDTHFVCHKATISEDPKLRELNLVCAGFVKAFPGHGLTLRLAKALQITEEVEIK